MAKIGFFVAHQDDEVLTMGGGIAHHVQYGHDVHVFLATDGSASGARFKLTGDTFCSWHDRFHDPIEENFSDSFESEESFAAARTIEFIEACSFMGVPVANIHEDLPLRAKDGELTVAQAETFIETYVNEYGIERVKTHTEHDTHSDHANLGKALRNLADAGKVTDARFYVKRRNWESTPETLSDEIPPEPNYVSGGADIYMRWNPEALRTGKASYGIGYHSVPSSFDALLEDIRSKYHT